MLSQKNSLFLIILVVVFLSFILILSSCGGGGGASGGGTAAASSTVSASPEETPTPSAPKYAYVSKYRSNEIDIYDAETFTYVKSMTGTTETWGICLSNAAKRDGSKPKYLYAADKTAVKRFDLTTQAIDASWNGPTGNNIFKVVISSNDERLYSLDIGEYLVYITNIAAQTSTEGPLIGLERWNVMSDIALTPNSSGLFLSLSNMADASKRNIEVIRTSDHTMSAAVSTLPETAYKIAINPAGTYAYIGASDDKIIVFNVGTKTIERIVTLNIDTADNFSIDKIVITPDGTKAYVICCNVTITASPNYGKIVTLSLSTKGEITQLAEGVNLQPYYINDIALSSDGAYLWAACGTGYDLNHRVYVIKASDMSIVKTFDTSAPAVRVVLE